MKKITTYLAIFTFLALASCDKFEQEPKERILETDIFDATDKEGIQAKAYLFGIYSFLPNGFNRIDGNFLDAATDDAIPSSERSAISLFTNGQLTAVNYPDNNWQNSYTIIRRCNIFINNIGIVPIPEELISRYIAEARFLRAFAYFELLKRYGGIPLIGDRVFDLKDDMQIPRATFSECLDYIAAECDAIKDILPKGSDIAAVDYGRVNSETALALKCRLLLYGASPLYNGGATANDLTIKNLNGYTNYDKNRWNQVISTAEAIIAQGYFKLPAATGTAAYRNIFITKINTDIIFAKQSANSTILENNNAPIGYVAPTTSNGQTSPTQDFLNAFPNSNGTPYTGTSTNLEQYQNRDPRLNAIIFYNGVQWLGRAVETFEGGLDKPNKPYQLQTRTSYYLRKFLGDFTTATTYANQSHNFPYFRYAEVLLSYAEALNEMERTEDATKQLIAIRTRAGISAGSNGRYGIPENVDQATLRQLIKNERRIELSFEEHRFWDIRRWKDAESINDKLTGLTLSKTNEAITAKETVVSDFKFNPKNYYMPLPYDEVLKNKKLIQNEGYY
ncbi:RagB/SusD family nutrient uptake outer membrane protein [Sphingobacterium sp. LRF_L2]|uniref:RagB/SusD family nutrient uptake outer membrane protein n=1 Tax=Sphingobacterium sp. LRF_L2 TaxID=3369421 RepID=UPI003F61DF1B